MNKIIYNGKEYELIEIKTERFLLMQDEPYPVRHNIFQEKLGNLMEQVLMYEALKFDGKYFGYRLIEDDAD